MKSLVNLILLLSVTIVLKVNAGNPVPPTSINGPRDICSVPNSNFDSNIYTYTLIQNSNFCHGKTFISVSGGRSSKSVLNSNNESFTVKWNENNSSNNIIGKITFTSEFDDDNCPEIPTLLGTNEVNVTIKPIIKQPGQISPVTSSPGFRFWTFKIDPVIGATSYQWSVNNSTPFIVSQDGLQITLQDPLARGYFACRIIVKSINQCGESDGTFRDVNTLGTLNSVQAGRSPLIYPNPIVSADEIYINTKNNSTLKIIGIFDEQGILVEDGKNIKINNNKLILNEINSGKYHIIYTENNIRKSQQIMVTN